MKMKKRKSNNRSNKGNKNKRKGTNFEYRVKYHLKKLGYHVIRMYASHGPADLIALIKNRQNNSTEAILVQCKNLKDGYKPLTDEEYKGLKKLSKITGGKPFHAYNDLKRKIVFKEIIF